MKKTYFIVPEENDTTDDNKECYTVELNSSPKSVIIKSENGTEKCFKVIKAYTEFHCIGTIVQDLISKIRRHSNEILSYILIISCIFVIVSYGAFGLLCATGLPTSNPDLTAIDWFCRFISILTVLIYIAILLLSKRRRPGFKYIVPCIIFYYLIFLVVDQTLGSKNICSSIGNCSTIIGLMAIFFDYINDELITKKEPK